MRGYIGALGVLELDIYVDVAVTPGLAAGERTEHPNAPRAQGEQLAKGIRIIQELGLDKAYGYKVAPSAVAA